MCSIQCLTGNSCSPVLIIIQSQSKLIHCKILHSLIALLPSLQLSLPSISLISSWPMVAFLIIIHWTWTEDFIGFPVHNCCVFMATMVYVLMQTFPSKCIMPPLQECPHSFATNCSCGHLGYLHYLKIT